MKKLFILLAFAITVIASAQAPQGFNYQATVRNSAGALIVNQNVNFKFNIMLNSQTSVPIYSETHFAPTDDLGQVNLTVGTGTPTTGTFSAINWAAGSYFLGIELNTGSGYVAMGTTQLLSVPYALYANSAGNSQSQRRNSISLIGNITNAQAAAKIAAEVGPETENIYIRNTTQLTSVDLSSITFGVDIYIENNETLTNINLSGLTQVANNFIIYNNPSLASIIVSNLSQCGLTSISYNISLSSLTFDSLQRASIYGNFGMVSGLTINNNNNLQSISFPVLSTASSLTFSDNSLSSLSLPALTKIESGYLNASTNSLPSSAVNSLLNKFLTVQTTNTAQLSLILSGQTPPAPPTGQGIIDKQTLINAGNYVVTD